MRKDKISLIKQLYNDANKKTVKHILNHPHPMMISIVCRHETKYSNKDPITDEEIRQAFKELLQENGK